MRYVIRVLAVWVSCTNYQCNKMSLLVANINAFSIIDTSVMATRYYVIMLEWLAMHWNYQLT